ncbi:MAG: phospholipase D family protein, partial [Chthoniobacterales bacterium]|nr:phospholipase D family protein [Chthoniobacterales bacterium]
MIGRCTPLPSLEGRTTSTAILETSGTRLSQVIRPLVEQHPGLSGIYPLADSEDAFAPRAHLAKLAERTLDVQYYMWKNDLTGTLLFEVLHAAADRGVRVRLLLDDNTTSGLDPTLAALDSHPNIEVRLFNPFVVRKPRIGYATDFMRANRRMHNKSFTADNLVTIIGGRNIADEYFGAAGGLLFVDLDVGAAGPVVTDVSRDFDRYWASDSSYPADRIIGAVDPARIEEVALAASDAERDPAAVAYMTAMRESPFVRRLVEGRLEFAWARTRMISDDPAKGLGLAAPEKLFPQKLREIIGDPSDQVDLVAPYYIPTASGADSFKNMAKRGLKVRVLTNSLAALDVPLVHAGYSKHRRALLDAGITLYEMHPLS